MSSTVADRQRIIDEINRIKYKCKVKVYFREIPHEENIVGYYQEAKSMLFRVYEVKPGYKVFFHGSAEDELTALEMLLKLVKRKAAVKQKSSAKPPSGWKVINGTGDQ